MTEFEKRIFDVIASSNGIKGADIAKALQVDKKEVNSTLYKSYALKALVTQDNNYKWHSIVKNRDAQESNARAPEPDDKLKRLCNYYLQCISLESSGSVSQFLQSKYSDFRYIVINGLKIDSGKDYAALDLLKKIKANKDKKAYLGYPIRIYTIHSPSGNYKKIAPVFLFPVDYTGGKVDVSLVPCINMEVVKGFSGEKGEALTNELVNLETDLGLNNPESDVEIDELIFRLMQIRQWPWSEEIDPYSIPEAEDITNFQDGIFNRPVIIEAEKSKYTDGLESELMALSAMPEEQYKGSSLYSWVHDTFQNKPSDPSPNHLLEVLPLNTEQSNAIETALNSELTIVTGPPGTGKSQVVTDLLANIAWAGKSALFSSRNNKAVDVVEARVNGLSNRPFLLRIGGSQHASRLAEIIEGLLNASAQSDDQSDLQFLQKQYDKLISKESELKEQREQLVQKRNHLDEVEQKYCFVRDAVDGHLLDIDENDAGNIRKNASEYRIALDRSKKKNNGFLTKLFWSRVQPKRLADLEAAEKLYTGYAARYGLVSVDLDKSEENCKMIQKSAEEFEEAIPIALEYRKALTEERKSLSVESIDQKLLSIKASRADLAIKLWDSWLKSKKVSLSREERSEMSDFVAAMKLTNDADLQDKPGLLKQYNKMVQLMTRILQCWAVTSLSAKGRIPFRSGIFDYVIIDEASQCDIASIMPLLFRAKRAVIIGDPQQLQHISQLSSKQDQALIQQYGIDPKWSYSANSLYGLARAKVQSEDIIQLRDHFRSCAEIIEYSNETFYNGSLRTATDYSKLKIPAGEKPGIRWVNVKGKTVRPNKGSAYNQAEIDAVINELRRLVNAGYVGTIGVTTPFHLQATQILDQLNNEPDLLSTLERKHEFLVDTVHRFQGDERDIMLFSSVVTPSAMAGTVRFLENTGNLFNVAVTRARSMLIVVGDYHYCASCSIGYLRKFVAYYEKLADGHPDTVRPARAYTREYPVIENSPIVSEWEKILYTALFDAGIKTIPQYPADRYKLDLALILSGGEKLDIEVDGEMYHRNWNKELSYRDQLRNQRMFELGWDVRRFWVYQVRDDLDWCIQQVKEWMKQSKQS